MKYSVLGTFIILFLSCATQKKKPVNVDNTADFTLAFGSCNKTDIPNLLWDDILNIKPDVWVWGGDNIYADTDDMVKLKQMYAAQNKIDGYDALKNATTILGTWDDHDYGLNDGGVEFTAKAESQQMFLDFMNVAKNDPLWKQEGIYTTKEYKLKQGTVNIIILDTRYFRTQLTPDTETGKRIKPNVYGEGTLLGEAQWNWLEGELNETKADFNVIVSSVQFLSNEHGFETWGNFPHEVDRLKKRIAQSKAKGVVILSGDRHISEFSKTTIPGMEYPLIDFTSSGLTHAYKSFSGEPNAYRVGEVIFTESFGVLRFNFDTSTIQFTVVGDNGEVLQELEQRYQ